MRVFKFFSVALLSFGLSVGVSEAQGFNGPAETPPASFKGKQYVDSRGCLFIRAGFGGQTRWIPRVSRSRKQVCQTGSRSASKAATRTTTRTARAAQGKIVDPLAGAPVIGGPSVGKVKRTTRTAAAAKPATRVVRQARPEPQPTATRVVRQAQPKTTTRVVRRVKPSTTTRIVRQQQQQQRIVRRTQPQTVTRVLRQPRTTTTTTTRVVPQVRTTTRVVRKQGSHCGNASAFSAQFINEGARCGPQEAPSRTIVGPQSSNTRVGPASAPRVIAEARTIKPPKGYKAAWKDDRLNPYRGVSRVSGKQEMQLVWSNTVPRRLVDPRTGKPIGGKRKLGILGF